MVMTDLLEAKEDAMLTTFDNPHNPFTEFDKWWKFDCFDRGYKTNELLARVVATSDELSEADEDLANEQAIQDILEFDPLGIYVRVTSKTAEIVAQMAREQLGMKS